MYLYGAFEEKGYRFESYVPDTDADPVEFERRILIGSTTVASFSIPMTYRPVFGVDVDDARTLEDVADAFIQALPEPAVFDDGTKTQLLDIVHRYHGGPWRGHRTEPSASTPDSTFASTGNDFTGTIAPYFPSQEASEAWLATPLSALEGLSPEQALRRGMVPEVIALVQERVRYGK